MFEQIILRPAGKNEMKSEIMTALDMSFTDVVCYCADNSAFSLKLLKIHFGEEKFSKFLDSFLKNTENYFYIIKMTERCIDYIEDVKICMQKYCIDLTINDNRREFNKYVMTLFKTCEQIIGFKLRFETITSISVTFSVNELKKAEIVELLDKFLENITDRGLIEDET